MPSFSFRIKSKEDKQVSIYVSFRPASSPPVFSRTGLSIHPDKWSASKKRAKTNSPHAVNLNTVLSDLESFLSEQLNFDQHTGVEINNSWLKKTIERFNNKVPATDLSYLLNLLDDMINSLGHKKANDGSIGLKANTIKGYYTFRNNLIEYEKLIDQKIKINEFGKSELDGFVKWLLVDMKYANNEAGRKIKRLKGLLKFGSSKGLTLGLSLDALGSEYSYKTTKYINVINEQEFFKIAKLSGLPPYLENIKRWILIGLSIGQRISDLQKIRKENIRFDEKGNALIDIIQVKGNTSVTVPVKNQIVVSVLKHKFPYRISDQNFNKYLKEVCKRAGLTDVITGYKFNSSTKRKELVEAPKHQLLASHDMRRSFATYHYDSGISVNLIMKITGHKRESTFFEYIGKNPKKDFDAYNFLNAIK